MFSLHPTLNSDTFHIVDLKLSTLLLMNDSNYPWLILVPRKEGAVEIIDLNFEEQLELLREINQVSSVLRKGFVVDKLNIAGLGNVVSQLHIHVIARKKDDKVFPKPVWGNAPAVPYKNSEAQELIKKIRGLLNE